MHMDPTWPKYQSRFPIEKAEDRKFYRIDKNYQGFIYSMHQGLISKTLTDRRDMTKKLFDVAAGKELTTLIDFPNTLARKYQDFRNTIIANPAVVADRSGLNQLEMLTALEKAHQYALEGLSRIPIEERLVTETTLNSKIEQWKESQYQFISEIFVREGDKPVKVKEEIFSPARTPGLDCGRFAFLYLKDEDFKKDGKPKLYDEHYLALLHSWHYRQVMEPNEGDLVVYFNDKKIKGKIIPQHYGVYLEDGKIISKKGGLDVDTIYIHDIATTSLNYGTKFAFFRKNPRLVN